MVRCTDRRDTPARKSTGNALWPQNHRVAKNSRVPTVVGAIPVVGGLAKSADSQAQWVQEVLEQNARLVGQVPTTIKTLNDSLEAFNATVQRLDRVVSTIESTTNQLVAPLEMVGPRLDRLASALDPLALKEIPDLIDAIRREALPALRVATENQKQLALLTQAVERILSIVGELPGAGIVKRFTPSSATSSTTSKGDGES